MRTNNLSEMFLRAEEHTVTIQDNHVLGVYVCLHSLVISSLMNGLRTAAMTFWGGPIGLLFAHTSGGHRL